MSPALKSRRAVAYLDVFINRGRVIKVIANNARHQELWTRDEGNLDGVVRNWGTHGVEIFHHTVFGSAVRGMNFRPLK